MLLITFLYEIKIINGTKNEPVDSAISYIYKISQSDISIIDSLIVRNGLLKFDIKDTSIKAIGIETRYKGYSFYSPILTLPLKTESLVVYEVDNRGAFNIKNYGAFIVNQDSIIMIAEDILVSTNSKNAIIPKEPIKLSLPKGFENFRYNGLPQDSVQVIGDSVYIKPFIVPNTDNLISFVYTVKRKIKLERNFGNVEYTVAVRKDLKHSVKNLNKADIQKMGNIEMQFYRGNKPMVIEAGVVSGFNLFETLDRNRYVVASVIVLIIVLIILILQTRKKGADSSTKSNQDNQQ